MEPSLRSASKLPLWTWIVPLIIFALGSEIAIVFKTLFGSSIFYLPLAFGFILLHWWGPRVLVALYLNSLIFSSRFGVTLTGPLVATHVVAAGLISWLLFRKAAKGECRLNNINDLIKFTVLGLMIPVAVNSLYYPLVFRVNVANMQQYWEHAAFLWLADFTTCFVIVIPVLYFFSPVMERLNLTLRYSFHPSPTFPKSKLVTNDVLIVLMLLVILAFSVQFQTYWFLFGICTLYLAVRHGFEVVAIGNLLIFLLVYVIPFMIKYPLDYTTLSQNSLAGIHLGMALLYVSSVVVGRVISDLKYQDYVLVSKNRVLEMTNEELSKVNSELDRFVYSVSHDLSAPLKTVKGLVNISRIEQDPEKIKSYIELINNRIQKLETFISEVIDYSRSNRRELHFENISLKQMTTEILELLSDLHNQRETTIIQNFAIDQVESDKMLLKIILNNILSNSIKYRSKDEKIKHCVSISSEIRDGNVLVKVSDNGEGIPLELQNKIFNMFFRGTLTSEGSGLGLYIAKEAATRIQARIEVNSVYGEGSEFIVYLPLRPVSGISF